MSVGTAPKPATLPLRGLWGKHEHPARVLLLWALGALVVGVCLGGLIEVLLVLVWDRPFEPWFLQASVLFSVFVAVSAVATSRYVLPSLAGSSAFMRYAITLMALTGAAFVAALVLLVWRFSILAVFEELPFFIGLFTVNLLLSILIGGAIIVWDSLQRSLARAYEDLRLKEGLEREMLLAREVQQDLLPKTAPQVDGLRFAFTIRSARQVGGDMLDFLQLDQGRQGFVVGDVVGKGMAAALMMANVQSLVRAVASVEADPAKLNTILSDVIAGRVRSGRFVTLAYLLYDPIDGQLHYSLAGHLPPLITGPNGVRVLEVGGMPLGLFTGVSYSSGRDQLHPDESLVLYTDGLTEAPQAGDESRQFGVARLRELLLEHHALDAEPLLERITDALDQHLAGAPPADDMTVVVIRRSPLEEC